MAVEDLPHHDDSQIFSVGTMLLRDSPYVRGLCPRSHEGQGVKVQEIKK